MPNLPRPPRLVWSASPSGYDLPRYPPVMWWGGHFIFFSKCPLRNTLMSIVQGRVKVSVMFCNARRFQETEFVFKDQYFVDCSLFGNSSQICTILEPFPAGIPTLNGWLTRLAEFPVTKIKSCEISPKCRSSPASLCSNWRLISAATFAGNHFHS